MATRQQGHQTYAGRVGSRLGLCTIVTALQSGYNWVCEQGALKSDISNPRTRNAIQKEPDLTKEWKEQMGLENGCNPRSSPPPPPRFGSVAVGIMSGSSVSVMLF